MTNLKLGMGEPCAGHVKAKLDCSALIGNDSKFLANWGFAEPIGSTKKVSHYLNDGIGDAWAGQVKAKLDPELSWKVADFCVLENFGIVPPIGSR